MRKIFTTLIIVSLLFISAQETKAACYAPTVEQYPNWSKCRETRSNLLCDQIGSDGNATIICCDSGSSCPANTTNPRQEGGGSDFICEGTTNQINTAIGCIPFDNSNALIGFILRWGIGIAGGIAFILIVVAGFQITTSRGDPNKLKAGQELLTSAIAGLILIIFSVFILRVIGVDILGITGLGR